jgi:hypothetical protein
MKFDRELIQDNSKTRTRHILSGDVHGNFAPQYLDFVEVMDLFITRGVNTPEFHKRKRSGELLPLTDFEQIRQNYSGGMSWSISHEGGSWQSCTWSPVHFSYPTVEDLHAHGEPYNTDYSVQAAAAKIYESGWDALTFIAELKQTLAMFRSIATRLIDKLRSGKLEDIWLEGRYGWRTLYFDIIEVSEMLSNLDCDRKRFMESAGITHEVRKAYNMPYVLGGAGTYSCSYVDDWSVGLRGTVVADVTPPKFRFNPITTAWELVRLSFVIDWVLNIGQALSALSFLLISHKHYSAGGIKVILQRSVSVGNFAPASGWTGSISGSAYAKYEWTRREPASVSLFPQYLVRLDFYKILDLLALIVQAIRK